MENKIIDLIQDIFKTNDCKVLYRLLGGMSNYTYVVLINNEKYTIRIPGEYAEFFVNRYYEEEDIKVFESLNITSKTVYFNPDNGVKISKYIEGTSLNELSNRQYEEVARLLKVIHNSKIKCDNDYNPFERLKNYEKYLQSLGYVLPEEYINTRNLFLTYQSFLEAVPKVLCHNDSQPSNFILGDKLYIVDFEFVGNNDYLYDIACFGNMEMNDAEELLKVYFKKIDNNIKIRFYLWRAFQCLQWYNIAMFKELKGMSITLKLDFSKIAEMYLHLAEENYGKAIKIKNK